MTTVENLISMAYPQENFRRQWQPIISIDSKELLNAVERIVLADGLEMFRPEPIEKQAKILTKWLRGDEEFHGKTTAFLWGNVGTGKTTLLRAVQEVLRRERKELKIWQALEMSEMASRDSEKFNEIENYQFLAIDDLGEEPNMVMNYGTAIFPFRMLFEKRYSLLKPTLISANLSPEDLGKTYGDRIADRIGQVAFSISFLENSLRTSRNFYSGD